MITRHKGNSVNLSLLKAKTPKPPNKHSMPIEKTVTDRQRGLAATFALVNGEALPLARYTCPGYH